MIDAIVTAIIGLLTWIIVYNASQYEKKGHGSYDIKDLKNEANYSLKHYIALMSIYFALYVMYVYSIWMPLEFASEQDRYIYFAGGLLMALLSFGFMFFPIVRYCKLLRIINNIEERELPADTNERIVKLVSHIISQNSYNHSMKYLQECTKKYSYGEFIKDFAEKTAIKPEQLDTTIRSIITQSTGAVFYCVLADDSYYVKDREDQPITELSAQTKGLIKYFLSFETGLRKNMVSRIFTEEAVCSGFNEMRDMYIKDIDKSVILFQYLCINYITMVKTYLLLYNKEAVQNKIQQFLYNIDYVLSIGGTDSKGNDQNNTLYFSYPDDKDGNSIIQTSDELLIRIALSDFEKRLSTLNSDKRNGFYYQCIMMDDRADSLNLILRALKLTSNEAIGAIDTMVGYIKSTTEIDIKPKTKIFVERKLQDIVNRLKQKKNNEWNFMIKYR